MRFMACLAVMAIAMSQAAPAWAQYAAPATVSSPFEGETPDMPRANGMSDAFIGVGGGSFNQKLGQVTTGGVAFNARYGVDGTGAWRFLGGEMGYQGLVANTDRADATLYGGIVGGNLRANLPMRLSAGLLRPYALGGVGWSHIAPSAAFTATLGQSADDSLAVPLGGGVSFFFNNGFGVDGRFVYNLLPGERAPGLASGDFWSVAVNAGRRWGG